jgi:chromosome segregation ATPase
MKTTCCISAWLLIFAVPIASESVNPIQKVLELLTELEGKVIKDGEAEQKAYEEYVEWCETGARDKQFEIKTAKADIEDLEATISKAKSIIEVSTAKIADLAASIATDEKDLKDATDIREKEHGEFVTAESELVDALDTLDRAIGIIEKNMKGSALVQTKVNMKDVSGVVNALKAVIDAASLNVHDKQTLLGLAQSSDADGDDDGDLGAPDPTAYKSHGGGILDVLEDMKEKAEGQLAELRKAEMNSKHNYEMLKQSLTDSIAVDQKDKADTEAAKSAATENQAVAEGDLAVTQKDLADAQAVLGGMSSSCMQTATDHEASVNGRAEELKALAEAKKLISEMTPGAESKSYSFLQKGSERNNVVSTSAIKTRDDLANFEVVNLIRRLAKDQHSKALSMLASKVSAAYRSSAALGQDPFAKVKTLISEMIDRLVKESEEEATHKAWCDKEMAASEKKKTELMYDIDKLTTKIDKAKAQSAKLKEESAALSKEIAEITKSQAEWDKIRQEENAAYKETKADLEKGLEGVRMALKVLKDYYSAGETAAFMQGETGQPAVPETHEKSSGAGSSIIGMLEVIESDFAKNLSEATTEEDSAAFDYEKGTQENKVSKTMKEQDVKYKLQEAASLDKAIAEDSSDLEGTQTELDSVLEGSKTIRAMCVAKPESYEERKARRESEIAGLKQALAILEGEAVFMQRKKHSFMGTKRHLH